jgi:RNA recognition motif-containing protein
MKKLFVGGLPYSFDDAALGALFADYGTVESAVIIKDRMTGRSKGFGFVEMSSEAEAEKAISAMNGNEVEGRRLNVSIARPMTEGPRPRR